MDSLKIIGKKIDKVYNKYKNAPFNKNLIEETEETFDSKDEFINAKIKEFLKNGGKVKRYKIAPITSTKEEIDDAEEEKELIEHYYNTYNV